MTIQKKKTREKMYFVETHPPSEGRGDRGRTERDAHERLRRALGTGHEATSLVRFEPDALRLGTFFFFLLFGGGGVGSFHHGAASFLLSRYISPPVKPPGGRVVGGGLWFRHHGAAPIFLVR